MSLAALDGPAVRRWLAGAHRSLVAHQREIDDLNVYPVPDGDTGTNLVLTMASVTSALEGAAADLAGTVSAAARAALLGARGNSGVILSQLLRGVSEAVGSGSARDLRKALRRAAELAYAAVAAPVEGTILSVARAAADAADAVEGDDLGAVVRAACDAAAEALRRTPSQLPALAAAGVVDAGGRGLCVVLDALRAVVTGEEPAAAEPEPLVPRSRTALAVARESGSDEYAYEVQYLLDAPSVDALREALARLGDSLVVVGGEGLWNVHVHVNDVGAAIEAGIAAGRPHRITVTRFADQIAAAAADDGREATGRAVVAVVQGDGLRELYEAAGATVVSGGPSACPSTGMLLDAVLAMGAAEVVLLPNDSNVFGPANAAAAEARAVGRDVHVVPTRSPVQGLAALAVGDPARAFADDAIGMSAAASATRWAEVTVAVRDAQTSAGACRAGDVLGLVLGDVAVIGSSVEDVACDVLTRMLGAGGELVTIVTGADAPAGLGDALAERVAAAYPLVEAEVHSGGQPHYPLLLGVE